MFSTLNFKILLKSLVCIVFVQVPASSSVWSLSSGAGRQGV